MRKVLYILSELSGQDIDWLIGVGSSEVVHEGEALVKQGEAIETLNIILKGRFSVLKGSDGIIAELGSGEIVGELSFLDARPPSADVIATEDSTVLAIPVARLKSKLRSDLGFASRFYRALGVLLADRLRDTTGQLAYGAEHNLDEEQEEYGEISAELLDGIDLAAARFDDILHRMLAS